jgi:hypothetical protein
MEMGMREHLSNFGNSRDSLCSDLQRGYTNKNRTAIYVIDLGHSGLLLRICAALILKLWSVDP